MRWRRGADATEPAVQVEPTPIEAADAGTIDVERALRLVRMAAAMVAIAAALGSRGTGGLSTPVAVAAILAAALGINAYTTWTAGRGWRTAASLGGQFLDVAASLGLVIVLDRSLDGSGWMVLLLPIVIGGVRFGASGTLLAWTLTCAGYLALALTGVVQVTEDVADAFGTSLQRFAFLLALAVPVAALTQWLQQRWEQQRRLTDAASTRAQRLEVVESLARSFIGSTEPRLLANLADGGVQLGFSTVTITMQVGESASTVATVGATRWLPTDEVAVRPAPGETLVTHWAGGEETAGLVSVSIALDTTGKEVAVHGWSEGEVDDDLARAFGLLGAHAGVALRAARMIASLEREAKQDPLTGLLNRRAFDEQLDRRAAAGSTVALLLLDVDHFKQINDQHGHLAGDRALRVVGARLTGAVTGGDPIDAVVARIGGDEFALILTDVPLERVADVADRIEASMREPVALETGSVLVSFSIGIADAEGAWAPRDLINAADEAAYQAKTHGRNRTCWSNGPIEADPVPSTGDPAAPPLPTTTPDPLMALLERSIEGTAPFSTPPHTRPTP